MFWGIKVVFFEYKSCVFENKKRRRNGSDSEKVIKFDFGVKKTGQLGVNSEKW